jgi:hypothetical protein
VVVTWRTEAGTATPGEDYYDASGEAVIPAGELETAIEVELLGDALPEAAETSRRCRNTWPSRYRRTPARSARCRMISSWR